MSNIYKIIDLLGILPPNPKERMDHHATALPSFTHPVPAAECLRQRSDLRQQRGRPHDARERPQSESEPLGRFILEQSGYLEPGTYAEGRLLSVVGTVRGTRAGRVGEADYTFPVMDARQIHLWPKDKGGGVSFGVGVGTWF